MTPAEKIVEKHNAQVRAGVGHNSDPNGSLKNYVDRLYNLEEEKRATSEDIRELKKEMKGNQVDPKAVAAIVKRKFETEEQREARTAFEDKVDGYLAVLGMLD